MGLAAAASCVALAGCGSESDSPAPPDDPLGLGNVSARFVETSRFDREAGLPDETVRGIFDWSVRRGRALRMGFGETTELVQIGNSCYSRRGDHPWRRGRVSDLERLCGGGTFSSPATFDDLMRAVTSLEEVGTERVRGVETRHYRGSLNIGAVKGPIELWVDGDGNTRRFEQRGESGGDFLTVREYFDFGVTVNVVPPEVKRKD